jgi:hypothetical protein
VREREFIHQDQHFPVERLVADSVCDGLAPDRQKNQLFVKSNITGDVPRFFVSAVNGEEIGFANESIERLSALCGEFQFPSPSRRLGVFKNTPTYRSDVGTLTNRVTSLETAQQSTFPHSHSCMNR